MLASEYPGQLSSASSAGAICMKLWRHTNNLNPRPKIQHTFEDYMKTTASDDFTKTADGGEFMRFKDWIDSDKGECMVIFMSDWAINILKTHPTWLFDGTFRTAPAPFTQVYQGMATAENGG